jgi:hypothetical protein|tara:strand:+ start:310 stop:486 length:177 start_codon:yes stop_codon:yes gene_type:complete
MKTIKDGKELNWGMIIILLLNAYYWVNVYWYGFFIPTIVTIIVAAVIGIIMRLRENRY